jgi:hypothetical protein
MKNIKIYIWAFLFINFWQFKASAQDLITLSVDQTLIDEDGDQQATVTLKDENGETIVQEESNSIGQVELQVVPDKAYTFVVSKPGYQTERVIVLAERERAIENLLRVDIELSR